jgi:hypothetical protein
MARRRELIQILRGTIGILLFNTLFVVICILLNPVSVIFSHLLSAIGFAQFLYIIPLLVILSYRSQGGIMKGIWVGAGLTALLNGGYHLFWILKR